MISVVLPLLRSDLFDGRLASSEDADEAFRGTTSDLGFSNLSDSAEVIPDRPAPLEESTASDCGGDGVWRALSASCVPKPRPSKSRSSRYPRALSQTLIA